MNNNNNINNQNFNFNKNNNGYNGNSQNIGFNRNFQSNNFSFNQNNFNNINCMNNNMNNPSYNNFNPNNFPNNGIQQTFNNSLNSKNNPSFNIMNNNSNQFQSNSYNMNLMQNSPQFNNNSNMNYINPIYNNMNMNMNNNSNMMTNQMCNMNNNSMPLPISNFNQGNNNNINKPVQKQNISENFKVLFGIGDDVKNYFPLVGLKNVGLTCYMNSTLQCLLHIPELNYYFINRYEQKKNYLNNINKSSETQGNLSKAYYELIKDIFCKQWKIEGNVSLKNKLKVSPEQFHNILGYYNSQFKEIGANDSKDLLLYLFQSMHEELNYFGDNKLQGIPKCDQSIPQQALNFFMKVNNDLNLSIFSYLFYGIFKSETSCLECGNKFYNFQHFQIISFPLYKYSADVFNIYRGFNDFIKPEIMKDDNQCYCKKCRKLTNCSVKTNIFSSPPYLIINLDYGKNKKFEPQKISFGENLDLKGFTDEDTENKTYKLVAVSCHIGRSGNFGHYIAYCKDPSDNSWYKFNDSTITPGKLDDIKEYSPYFLIYKKETRYLINLARENNITEN